MNDKNLGVYGKYVVVRSDGSSAPGKKHEFCAYFVLDLNHDPFAWPALDAYAGACSEEYPLLAEDLRGKRVLGADRPATNQPNLSAFGAACAKILRDVDHDSRSAYDAFKRAAREHSINLDPDHGR